MWNWITDSTVFMARTHCGVGWTPQLISVAMLSNFLIFLSYTSIPLTLLFLNLKFRKLNEVPYNPMIVTMFMIFILSCGLGHLMDVLVFYWPMYRLFTIIDFITAVSSVATAIVLPIAMWDLVSKFEDMINAKTKI